MKVGRYKLLPFDDKVCWISEGDSTVIVATKELEGIIGMFYESQLLEKKAEMQGWERKLNPMDDG